MATGQSQSEVSEILKGRQVLAYDVLIRICQGLSIPRECMGLGYGDTHVVLGGEEDEDVKRRNLLKHAAAIVFGQAILGESNFIAAMLEQSTPRFGEIGMNDVTTLHVTTARLRELDREYGGGGIVNMVGVAFDNGNDMMRSAANDAVRKDLAAALADLGNLCAWTTNDVGLGDIARHSCMSALDYAGHCGERSIISTALRVTGRIEGHRGDPNHALKFLQMAEVDSEGLAKPTIKADSAKLYAQLGLAKHAKNELSTCADYVIGDIKSVTGEAKLLLGDLDGAHVDLMAAMAGRDRSTARSAAIEKTLLAQLYLATGENTGLDLAHDAIAAVGQLPGSARTAERLAPVVDALARNGSTTARQLADDARKVMAHVV